MSDQNQTPQTSALKSIWKEITDPFVALVKAPQVLWGINLSYAIEGLAYFGVLTLLTFYFPKFVGLDDAQAGRSISYLTAGITLSMLFLGSVADWLSIRKALIISVTFMLVGRIFMTIAPGLGTPGSWGGAHAWAMFGVLWIVIGYGIYQPACYAGVKQFSTKETAAIGYAMLYALMNLGGFLVGFVSPFFRKTSPDFVQNLMARFFPNHTVPAEHDSYGILGVFWVYVILTVLQIIVIFFFLSRKATKHAKAVAEAISEAEVQKEEDEEHQKSVKERMIRYLKHFPITDGRFMFFIFILIPVQTLFAHNWLTLPPYFERAFRGGIVSEYFDFFSNLNPLLIFILCPIFAALTAKKDTYKMMIIGTFVMAFPAFFFVIAPNLYTVLAYLFIMTIGEALWQPRFLQWVAEIAPKNMTGIYMGIGQFPWFLTKVLTGMYSGWFLMKYCPDNTPVNELHTEFMWFIYGLIAISSPIALFLAKNWMGRGLHEKRGS